MKQLLNILLGLLIGIFSVTAQTYTFKQQEHSGFRITTSNKQQIRMKYTMQGVDLKREDVKGESMQRLQLLGTISLPGREGMPDLPMINKNFALPQGAKPTLQFTITDSLVLQDVNIAPNRRIPFDTEPDFPIEKAQIYTQDTWYPKQMSNITISEVRGMHIAQLHFCPFKYNPVRKTLVIYKTIDFDMNWVEDRGFYVEERFRSRYWDVILQDYISNYKDIPAVDYNKQYNTKDTEGCEYLIVIPDKDFYHVWADSLQKFRNEQGIATRVMTIPEVGGNTVSNLNSFFEQVYNTWNPVPAAVLLMADYAEDDNGFIAKSWTHPYEGIYISDNYYADVTGNRLPDFVFARMTANTEEQLETMVSKCIQYETNPPQTPDFYDKPITALGWQTERWFQLCSEIVGGYMHNNMGKHPIRINAVYEGNPAVDPWSTAYGTSTIVNVFGTSGLAYIPDTPGELGDWTGGSSSDVVDALNQGSFMLLHRDHGFYGGWGEPSFTSGSIKQLNNIDALSHVFSINCLTGQFNKEPGSFAERLHRHTSGGAVSVTAATQVSYSFVNDVLVWGMFDNMWPDFLPDYGTNSIAQRGFLPAFSLASGKYYLSTSNWSDAYYKKITYRLFHHHGDAFNTIYYEQPKKNIVLHDKYIRADKTSIRIEALEGSLVGLSKNGTLLASANIPASGFVDLEFPAQSSGEQLKIVITKQNYLRYESAIEIVPANGTYISINKVVYDDANGNDSIENGEQVNIHAWIKNISAENINTPIDLQLSSNNPHINIIQDHYTIPNLASGEAIEVDVLFRFSTTPDIEDLEQLRFNIQVTTQNFDKTFNFNTLGYAPKLYWGSISFEEVENGNGNAYIDPGETVIARIKIINKGHAPFPAGSLSLSSSDALIDVINSPQNFELLQRGDSIVGECNISCEASVPMHSNTHITAQIQAPPLAVQKDLYFSIGQIIEDWEAQDFNTFDWHHEGDGEWEISDKYAFDGEYAACSPDLEDNETASLVLHYNCAGEDNISFHIQVSSQFNHDFLSFYIDDELQGEWSKLILFNNGFQSFPVSAGQHTFKWTYAKDSSGHSGLDKCWLDHIILPTGESWDAIADNKDNESTNIVHVYPNPAKDYIYVSCTANLQDYSIELWNSLGQMVKTIAMPLGQAAVSIPTTGLQNGIYFIRVVNTNHAFVETKKVLLIK